MSSMAAYTVISCKGLQPIPSETGQPAIARGVSSLYETWLVILLVDYFRSTGYSERYDSSDIKRY